jgi:membrane fusion protein, multidrug efflux system
MAGNNARQFSVISLTSRSVTVHNDFPATLQGQRVIEIRPMVSGYLKDMHVKEGQRVVKGQLLFTINNPQFEQDVITAKAKISSATADLNTARMEIEKVKPLVEKEIVSNYRLQSLELNLQAKEAELEQARAALKNAETNLGYTIIRSPESGIIGMIPYKSGALVGSSNAEPLTTLSDISEVFAYFSWNEKQVLDLLSDSQGETVEDKVDHFPPATLILSNSVEYPLKGRIEMASGLISTETGSATLKAIFKNPDGVVRSGSSALIRIPRKYDNVLLISQSATYELQDKRFIYKVKGGNKVTSVMVGCVPTDNGKYFIVTSGLQPGDTVVTEGVISLKEGDVIRAASCDTASYYKNIGQ